MTKPCPKCLGTGRVPDQKVIGEKYRSMRQRHEITMRDMASRLDISAPYLHDLETGRRNWTLKLKAKADRILK